MRQREKAKEIRDRFKGYGWGMSHGFFIIMGGFALYDGEEFRGHLWDRKRGERWRYPYDGQSEALFGVIKDYHKAHQELENKRNGHAKSSASSTPSDGHEITPVMPTQETSLPPSSELTTPLEFLVAKGYITLTEDEIKDKSHADVITKSIAVIQTTWFIMQVIARAVEGLAITELEIVTVGFAILNFGTYFLWWNKPLRVGHHVRVYWRHREMKIERKEGQEGPGEEVGKRKESWLCWLGRAATNVVGYIYLNNTPKGFASWILKLSFLPLVILDHIFIVCFGILIDRDSSALATPISSRLGNDPLDLYITVYGIAALFGAIHCIPWVFHFPTHIEQLLWRISAVAVAVAPVAMGLLHGYWKRFLDKDDPDLLDVIAFILILILSLAYAVFRISLIVIAFTSLRDLSPSAYQTVQWTILWPHIG
ncbi:hypothetical protein VNI00_016264 [Paramarasmius palmivorus]|uniref:Uncharacterized protein n=1 Tax=Paramarasmius palmivorus TaxID=297713 RepID=A0AAW0BD22_9AGAR